MKRRLIYARLVRGCWAGLFVLQIAWWGWLAAPPPVPRAVMIFIAAGPLLLPLRGLLYDRPRTYFWFNLLVLPYFALGVSALWAEGGDHPIAWMQVALCVVAFVAGFLRTKHAKAL
jgi:uncharacterized membrane protein